MEKVSTNKITSQKSQQTKLHHNRFKKQNAFNVGALMCHMCAGTLSEGKKKSLLVKCTVSDAASLWKSDLDSLIVLTPKPRLLVMTT